MAWQRQHGRHDLPWQGTRDPYRVWLSEIMLQQTQVATVLDYYPSFLARFPDVQALAAAPVDAVMAAWSGLGYYSRARWLHRCAQVVVAEHGGRFPSTAAALQALPGIGRSTAAAIAAFCHGERVAILDGNVKRVLSRALGFDADLAQAANVEGLWDAATALLPRRQLAQTMPTYTQGLMDLGATVCVARRARCGDCPLAGVCVAHAQGDPQRYPVVTRRLRRSQQALWLLLALDGRQRVWLERRPPSGIWAGLHAPPMWSAEADCRATLPAASEVHTLPPFRHVLTHRDLDLHPLRVFWPAGQAAPAREAEGAWFDAAAALSLGLPAPVRRLLQQCYEK